MTDDTSTSNFSFAEADDIENGSFIDLQTLPTSGYSLVIKARRYGKWLALKGLKEEYRHNPVYVDALRKEYDILSTLHHPNIISADSFEVLDEVGPCIVMEYAGGTSLRDALKEGLKREEKLQIIGELLDAVDYLHKPFAYSRFPGGLLQSPAPAWRGTDAERVAVYRGETGLQQHHHSHRRHSLH